MIQLLYHDRGATFGVAIRHSKASIERCDTVAASCDTVLRQDAVRAAGIESRYNFLYRDRGGGGGGKATALRHGSVRAQHDLLHGQCVL